MGLSTSPSRWFDSFGWRLLIRQVGSAVWGYGFKQEGLGSLESGRMIVFHCSISGSVALGSWAEMAGPGPKFHSGKLELKVQATKITIASQTGQFPVGELKSTEAE